MNIVNYVALFSAVIQASQTSPISDKYQPTTKKKHQFIETGRLVSSTVQSFYHILIVLNIQQALLLFNGE